MKNWKQLAASKPSTHEPNEALKLRSEIIRLKAQISEKEQQSEALLKENCDLKNRMKKVQDKSTQILGKIGYFVGQDYSITLIEMLKIIEQKVVEQHIALEQFRSKYTLNSSNIQSKDERIKALQNQITFFKSKLSNDNKQAEILRKNLSEHEQKLLNIQNDKQQISYKYNELQRQYKVLWQHNCEMRQTLNRSKNSRAESLKKQCEQLLSHIAVRDDEYLRGYLINNGRYQKNLDIFNKRDKYDFIFQS